MNEETKQTTLVVERQRLDKGGDVAVAMSADIIVTTYSSAPKIRRPFSEGGKLYVVTSILMAAGATAYELVACDPEAADERAAGDQFAGRKVQFEGSFFRIQGPPLQVKPALAADEESQPAPDDEQEAAEAAPPAPAARTETPQSVLTHPAAPDEPATAHEEPAGPAATAAPDGPASHDDSDGEADHEDAAPAAEDDDDSAGDEDAGGEDEDASDKPAAGVAATPNAKPPAPPQKKVYTELLPDRPYAMSQVAYKLVVRTFVSDNPMLGRDVRVSVQVYDHPPLIMRFREIEDGGMEEIHRKALMSVETSLPGLEAAYKAEQHEAAEQVRVKQEKATADKLRQQVKKSKAASTTTVKAAPAQPAPAAAAQPSQAAPAPQTPQPEAAAPEPAPDEFADVPVIDNDRPGGLETNTAPPAPPATTPPPAARTSSRKAASPTNQGSFF